MVHIYYPTTPEGQAELERRVANIHADAVATSIKKQPCSAAQKRALLKQVCIVHKKEVGR